MRGSVRSDDRVEVVGFLINVYLCVRPEPETWVVVRLVDGTIRDIHTVDVVGGLS